MLKRIKYNKFIYFWFLPFSVGVCLSAGYIITHKVFLKSSQIKNYTTQYQEDTIKNNNKESDNGLSSKEKVITIKNNTDEKLLSENIITINAESSLSNHSDAPPSNIQSSKTVNQSKKETKTGNYAENSMLLKEASSDKLEKIFTKLFQTLPKR